MSLTHLCNPREHVFSRRAILGAAGAVGLGSLLRPAVADDLKQKHKQVLFIWIDGGMSQYESWDPKPNTQFGGPFRAIPTSVPGIHVSELLPKCAQQMQHLSIVRSICTKDNAHSSGVGRIQRGDPKNRGVTYPYFGSAVAKFLGSGPSGLPPYVWIKPGSGGFIYQDAGFLGPKYGALAFGDGKPPENLLRPASLGEQDDQLRNELREKLNARYARQHRPAISEANSFVYDMARELMGEEAACLAYYDQPELMHDIMATLTDTALRVLGPISEKLVIDQLSVHEDFAGRSGPLVGQWRAWGAGPAQVSIGAGCARSNPVRSCLPHPPRPSRMSTIAPRRKVSVRRR